jgi:hypothetical protein
MDGWRHLVAVRPTRTALTSLFFFGSELDRDRGDEPHFERDGVRFHPRYLDSLLQLVRGIEGSQQDDGDFRFLVLFDDRVKPFFADVLREGESGDDFRREAQLDVTSLTT